MEYKNFNMRKKKQWKYFNAKSPISSSEKLSGQLNERICGKDVVRPKLENSFAYMPKKSCLFLERTAYILVHLDV